MPVNKVERGLGGNSHGRCAQPEGTIALSGRCAACSIAEGQLALRQPNERAAFSQKLARTLTRRTRYTNTQQETPARTAHSAHVQTRALQGHTRDTCAGNALRMPAPGLISSFLLNFIRHHASNSPDQKMKWTPRSKQTCCQINLHSGFMHLDGAVQNAVVPQPFDMRRLTPLCALHIRASIGKQNALYLHAKLR